MSLLINSLDSWFYVAQPFNAEALSYQIRFGAQEIRSKGEIR